MIYCPQCGAKLVPDARFCHMCGFKVESENRSEEGRSDAIEETENL